MTTVLCTNAYKAARVVKVKGHKTLPILNTIHLYHHEGRLAMTTYDLTEGKHITEYISCRWEGELWETCVPARAFTDWLYVTQNKSTKKTIVPDQIELTFDASLQILKIKAGNTRAEFKCIDAQEFPAMPAAQSQAVSEFEAMVIKPYAYSNL